jgi:hypothetical protein
VLASHSHASACWQVGAVACGAQAPAAEGSLASARALTDAARSKADRYELLSREQVVSELDYTEARAAAAQAAASVQPAQAALGTASVNLRFTQVPAPIQGQAAPGPSSGDAMDRIAAIAGKLSGTSVAWIGLSYQERTAGGRRLCCTGCRCWSCSFAWRRCT